MEAEYVIKSEDDEIEAVFALWRADAVTSSLTDRELREHAETLVSDISRYSFDLASNADKFERYGREFLCVMKSKAYDAIKHVDLYWIHDRMAPNAENEENSYNLIIEASTHSADAGCQENVTMREFLAARYLLGNLHTIDGEIFFRILSEARHVNVRRFIDAALKHEKFDLERDFSDLVTFFEKCAMTSDSLLLHRCIEENEIFLLDFLMSKLLSRLSDKRLKKILKQMDGNENNIFHLACERRIKFLIEEIWAMIHRVYAGDPNDIENYLLRKNNKQRNGFQLAFQMPHTYYKRDFANEIKNRNALLSYSRNPAAPVELEMYNFETCLNFLYDIARRNVKKKKNFIVDSHAGGTRFTNGFEYGKEFADFRCDFIQIRFYCITRLCSRKTNDEEIMKMVYNFLSFYVDAYINCSSESEIIDAYQKLSFDGFLSDFFKIFVHRNFCRLIERVKSAESFGKLIEILKRTLTQQEYQQVMMERGGAGGQNILQLAISSDDPQTFKMVWSSLDSNSNTIVQWTLVKNIHRLNSLYMVISKQQVEMLKTILEYFSCHLEEADLMDIFENSTKTNYKFLDISVLHYSQPVFNLLVDFIQNHLSPENKKKILSSNIILLAASKWQESALVGTLNLIESLFDESEIRELLFGTNWEGQTAFHAASRNSNLSQLQTLCKFARYYLTEEDFVKIVSAKDMNDYSIVNETATHSDIYNNLPNMSNFFTNFPVYVWISVDGDNVHIPSEAVEIGIDEDGEALYLARRYSWENNEVELFGIKRGSDITNMDDRSIDVLTARGVEWLPRDNKNIKIMNIESEGGNTFNIARHQGMVKLITEHSEEQFDGYLCTNDQVVYETNQNNFIFKKSF